MANLDSISARLGKNAFELGKLIPLVVQMYYLAYPIKQDTI